VELRGRVALVTGAGRRLGRAIALALAGRGMTVAVHYHQSIEGAEETRSRIVAGGGRAELFEADLRDAEAAHALPGRAVAALGQLDVLVNSAATMQRLSVEETTPAAWDDIFALNLRSAFFCAQGAMPALRASRGRIVNIADVGGLEPWAGYAAHCISKAGVVMLTRTLARALAPDITVNAVAPGAVLLPEDWGPEAGDHLRQTTPLQRLGSPEDAVGAVLFLLEGGDFLTGQTIVVDGGRLVR